MCVHRLSPPKVRVQEISLGHGVFQTEDLSGKQAALQKQNIRSSTNKVVITTGGYKNLLQQRQGFKIDHNNFIKQRHDCRFLGQRKEPFLIKVTGRA